MAKTTAKSVINTLIIALVVCISAYNTLQENSSSVAAPNSTGTALTEAFNRRQSDIQVHGAGVVVKVLRDDTTGSRHQKMLLDMPSGQTILIAHNIDLAPRIKALRKGDTVEFYGEYEYTAKGGVVHWTHRDPGRRHEHGWLKHNGNTYQ